MFLGKGSIPFKISYTGLHSVSTEFHSMVLLHRVWSYAETLRELCVNSAKHGVTFPLNYIIPINVCILKFTLKELLPHQTVKSKLFVPQKCDKTSYFNLCHYHPKVPIKINLQNVLRIYSTNYAE